MILIKNDLLKKIKDWEDDSFYILTDFDRTLTAGYCDSTWGLLSKSEYIPKEYSAERKKLFEYYRPIEINEELDYETKNKLMIEWWQKHINLLIKYNLTEELINKSSKESNALVFREGAKEFLVNMRDRNIPVIIISAGIGNFIKQFLINNNCDFDNIFIISNFIKFKDGIAHGVNDDVIHSLNKDKIDFSNEIKDKIKNKKNIILFGDNISDVKMSKEQDPKKILKIGFLEEKIEENRLYFEGKYDVVCVDNIGFSELSSNIPILKK